MTNPRIQTLRRDKHVRQLVKYVLVGGLTTLVNFAVYGLLILVGVHYLAAAVVAFLVATLNSYTLNRVWTYQAGAHTHSRFAKFLITQLTGLAINLSVLALLVETFGFNK